MKKEKLNRILKLALIFLGINLTLGLIAHEGTHYFQVRADPVVDFTGFGIYPGCDEVTICTHTAWTTDDRNEKIDWVTGQDRREIVATMVETLTTGILFLFSLSIRKKTSRKT